MTQKRLAILGGGGPAPGMNAVLAAAAQTALDRGYEVLGLENGFRYLIKGDTSRVQRLNQTDLLRIQSQGGMELGMARDNPTKSPELMAQVIKSLETLGVTHLVGIGGDDTNTSLAQLALKAPHLAVAGIPKTIDNDIGLLPDNMPTFGFETARHVGAELARNYLEDARTNRRWFILVVMGRSAGFLTLGVGNAIGAQINILPEELPHGTPLKTLRELSAVAILKAKAKGQDYGVLLVGEGCIERINPDDIKALEGAEVDDHGHIRYAEIDFGGLLRSEIRKTLGEFDQTLTATSENLGYALRCANPIGFDREYCRTLGFAAVDYFEKGGRAALVYLDAEGINAVPFEKALNAKGRVPTRQVKLGSAAHQASLAFQTRLTKRDLLDPKLLEKLGGYTKLTPDEFAARFGYLAAFGG
jgi:ATP-dependent phosphofructokinase / diphosphate-dependent phosphofructokinase